MSISKIKLLSIFAILLICSFSTTSFLSYYSARNSLFEKLHSKTLPLAADKLHLSLKQEISFPITVAKQMANNIYVQDWLRNGEEDPKDIERYLQKIQFHNETFTSYYISDKTKRYYHPNGDFRVIDQGNDDHWYHEAKASKANYVLSIDQDEMNKNKWVVFVNYRSLDQKGAFLGITGVGVHLQSLQKHLDEHYETYKMKAYIVNKSGEVLFFGESIQDSTLFMNPKMLQLSIEKLKYANSPIIQINDEQSELVFVQSLGDFGWYLVLEDTMDRFDEVTKKALILNVSSSIIITILVLIIGYSAFSPYEQSLKKMAMIDPLSNALNRRAFHRFYQDAISSIERGLYERFSIVLLDIDKFKDVNDYYGHLAGDNVIKGVSNKLHAMLRKSDVVCRWGGEEFILLLPNCDALRAKMIAEKIRSAIEYEVFSIDGNKVKITISGGVIDFKLGDDESILIEKADRALYRAKETGRNKIILAES